MNKGAQALRTKGLQKDIARRCGVTEATISNWTNGRKKPDYQGRKTCRKLYGILEDAWDEDVATVAGR